MSTSGPSLEGSRPASGIIRAEVTNSHQLIELLCASHWLLVRTGGRRQDLGQGGRAEGLVPPLRKSRVGRQGGKEIIVGQQRWDRVLLRGWGQEALQGGGHAIPSAQGHMRRWEESS